MKKHLSSSKNREHVLDFFYDKLPYFTDIFHSEEKFYVAAFAFVIFTILLAFILSRFITIKPVSD